MQENENPEGKSKKKKKDKQSKSIETMFRTTLTNHIQVSAMADQKAGLMVSINSIILSIMVSLLIQQVASNPRLLLPTCFLVLVCLLTITFALLATKPAIKPTKDIDRANLDLLFFGDYTILSLEEYKDAMKEMMTKNKYLHEQMIENIYAQGRTMKRKYRLLGISYWIFIIGFPLALLSFLYVLA